MKQILDAANEGLISPTEMFDRLRSVAATMGADPNQLKQNGNAKLADMGVLGEYLEDLPYQSEVLNLDEETWKSWDGLAQERFIRNLSTKLRHYQRYNADVMPGGPGQRQRCTGQRVPGAAGNDALTGRPCSIFRTCGCAGAAAPRRTMCVCRRCR